MNDSEGLSLDIQKYCALNDEVHSRFLMAPFRVGDLVCATNRHIIICIDDTKSSAPEIPDGNREKVEEIISKKENVELVDIPSWTKPDTEECYVCNGRGFELLSICPTCKGIWESGHWCKTCDDGGLVADENGSKYRCDKCSGSGELTTIETDRFVRLLPNCAPIDFQYIEMISALPSVKIGALPERNGIVFSFEGGFGVVIGGMV